MIEQGTIVVVLHQPVCECSGRPQCPFKPGDEGVYKRAGGGKDEHEITFDFPVCMLGEHTCGWFKGTDFEARCNHI